MLAAEAQSLDAGYLEHWALVARNADNEIASRLADFAISLVQSRGTWRKVVSDMLKWLPQTAGSEAGIVSDAEEDRTAWESAARAIRSEKGGQPDLDELLQGMALRPKEPPPDPRAVRLMTIHAAKGLEFYYVWVIGVAEQILPSWQSLKASALPAELEEERRNFFVAITRTRKQLVLSHASQYRGWPRRPSRFVAEMSLNRPGCPD